MILQCLNYVDSNTTKKTLQDNSKTDGFIESKGVTINKPTAGV